MGLWNEKEYYESNKKIVKPSLEIRKFQRDNHFLTWDGALWSLESEMYNELLNKGSIKNRCLSVECYFLSNSQGMSYGPDRDENLRIGGGIMDLIESNKNKTVNYFSNHLSELHDFISSISFKAPSDLRKITMLIKYLREASLI